MSIFDDRNTEAGRAWTNFWYAVWVLFSAFVISLALSAGAQSAPSGCTTAENVEEQFAKLRAANPDMDREITDRFDFDRPEEVKAFFDATRERAEYPYDEADVTGITMHAMSNGVTFISLYAKNGDQPRCMTAWVNIRTDELMTLLKIAPGASKGGKPWTWDPMNTHREYDI